MKKISLILIALFLIPSVSMTSFAKEIAPIVAKASDTKDASGLVGWVIADISLWASTGALHLLDMVFGKGGTEYIAGTSLFGNLKYIAGAGALLSTGYTLYRIATRSSNSVSFVTPELLEKQFAYLKLQRAVWEGSMNNSILRVNYLAARKVYDEYMMDYVSENVKGQDRDLLLDALSSDISGMTQEMNPMSAQVQDRELLDVVAIDAESVKQDIAQKIEQFKTFLNTTEVFGG